MESWREELYHAWGGKGTQRKDHKYISREWVNGKWVYYYRDLKGNKKQSNLLTKAADKLGADEVTRYNTAINTARNTYFKDKPKYEMPGYKSVTYSNHGSFGQFDSTDKNFTKNNLSDRTVKVGAKQALENANRESIHTSPTKEVEAAKRIVNEIDMSEKAYDKTFLGKVDKIKKKLSQKKYRGITNVAEFIF